MFPNHRIRITASLTLIAIVTAATAIATPRKFTTDPGSGGNSMVFPTNSRPFGKTYGEWSAAHWQWLFSIPGPINPANDPTGVNAAVGQSGPVWFLAGSFCPEPPTPCSNFTLTRTITVPAGKALFFPIIDSECSTLEGNGTTEAELSACAEGFMNLATGMSCDVDGVPVQNLDSYRVQSPLFTFGPLPPDNIFGAPAGSTSVSVSDGVFLMLHPLSAGSHTIHFTGAFPDFGFGMDITYNITVAGGSSASETATDALRGTWGRLKQIYR